VNDGENSTLPRSWQFGVAVALLIVFGVIVVYMLIAADSEAQTWERRVYIFSGVEAIVFTAVGWIFGREVHRQTAVKAEEDAKEAKAEVKEKNQEVKELAAEAEKGRALKAAVEAATAEPAPAQSGPSDVGARQRTVNPPALASLKDLAAKLYE
jgi:hypothetical protein